MAPEGAVGSGCGRLVLAHFVRPAHHAGPAVHHVQETLWLPLLISVFVGLTGRVAVLPPVRLLGLVDGIPAVGVQIDEEQVIFLGRHGDRNPGVPVCRRKWRRISGRGLGRRL